MHALLSERGSLYLHADWRAVHYIKIALDEIFGPENFLNEIIWQYRTGGRSQSWFARKHDTILLYARRAGHHVFNLQHEGAFRTDGLITDGDGRPYKNTRKGRLYFNKQGPAMSDVWDLPFLSTVSRERTGYPSQKPLALLRRIISASSDPGDLVADFFCGSGTTLLAAQELNRCWVGCDIEPQAIRVATRRLGIRGTPNADSA
jgi:site-specific DNA-methyltransferase (adenine-specific)